MVVDPNSFVAKYGVKTLSYTVGIGFAVLLFLLAIGSCATTVNNTDVGIVVNNITGQISLQKNGGMVLHLPFGLSTVYHVDKQQKSMHLNRDTKTQEHPEGDQVKIKTNDGSTVEADVDIVYQVDVENAYVAYRELFENTASNSFNGRSYGRLLHESENNIESILRAVTRAEVRNMLGELSTLEMAEPGPRTSKLHMVQQKLAEYFKPMAVEIVSVNAQNFHFNEEYEKIVRDRKSADQILVNQKDFQNAKTEIGKRMIAEATKKQKTALAQLQGELNKRLLTAQGEAKRAITKAEQEAYQLDREGEIALANATQEAAALKTEGELKAQAIEKLFEAYEKGGEGLVREALVKLYEGAQINAKPYSQSDRIDRYQFVPAQLEAPAKPANPIVVPPARGGSNGR